MWPPPTSDGSGCEGADRERFAPGACNTWRIFRIETLIFSSRGAQKDGTLAHISVRVPASPSCVTKCALHPAHLAPDSTTSWSLARFACTPRYIPRLRPMLPSMGHPMFPVRSVSAVHVWSIGYGITCCPIFEFWMPRAGPAQGHSARGSQGVEILAPRTAPAVAILAPQDGMLRSCPQTGCCWPLWPLPPRLWKGWPRERSSRPVDIAPPHPSLLSHLAVPGGMSLMRTTTNNHRSTTTSAKLK